MIQWAFGQLVKIIQSPQSPYQPSFPQSPHSQHHSSAVIFLIPPIRIAQNQSREPKPRSDPSGDGDASGIQRREDVDERQEDRIALLSDVVSIRLDVAICLRSICRANEAKLIMYGRSQQHAELRGERFSRSDEDGNRGEEEEKDSSEEGVDGNEGGYGGREEGKVNLDCRSG